MSTDAVLKELSLPSPNQPPTPITNFMDRIDLPALDLTMGDVSISLPTPAYKAHHQSPCQARVARLIKTK
jgi:hypothetical protein